MKFWTIALLTGLFVGTAHGSEPAPPPLHEVEGHKWEFSQYDPVVGVAVIVHFDLTRHGLMTTNVTCEKSGEVIRLSVRGPVVYAPFEIFNPTTIEGYRQYFRDRSAYCTAAIPARRLSYDVIDEDHVTVFGDPLAPEGRVWTRVD